MKNFLLKIKELILEKKIALFLTLYFIINTLFLTKYPFMHSDESWLSGLSRIYLENNSPIVTESFFDLLPRFPHSIKIFFHYIQAFFSSIMGYKLFTFRFISLLFGVFTLYLIYKTGQKFLKSKILSFFLTLIIAFDVHFIYTSHFARQEAVILFFIIFAFYFYISKKPSLKKSVILGIITGLNIGIHPNSLFIAAIIGSLYFYDIIFTKKIKAKELLLYIFVTGIFASGFIAVNLYFDSNFFYNYKEFGDQFNVFAQPTDRISEIKNFYLKLYYQVSGTYYIPNIKFQLLFFPLIFTIAFIQFILKKDFSKYRYIGLTIFTILSINITYIIIGRYNQTSIIFIFPFFWLLFILSIKNIKYRKTISLSVAMFLLIVSIFNIIPFLNNDYENYIENISSYVDSDKVVLANLNTEYYFSYNNLYDYRNLNYLKQSNITFSEYIKKNDIEYIIYPEEMDFIYNTRPVWNFIYGNLYYYYEDMQNFLENNCQLIDKFNSPYAMRLSMYMYEKPWSVKIYKVNY